jgi:hypothetical protein
LLLFIGLKKGGAWICGSFATNAFDCSATVSGSLTFDGTVNDLGSSCKPDTVVVLIGSMVVGSVFDLTNLRPRLKRFLRDIVPPNTFL